MVDALIGPQLEQPGVLQAYFRKYLELFDVYMDPAYAEDPKQLQIRADRVHREFLEAEGFVLGFAPTSEIEAWAMLEAVARGSEIEEGQLSAVRTVQMWLADQAVYRALDSSRSPLRRRVTAATVAAGPLQNGSAVAKPRRKHRQRARNQALGSANAVAALVHTRLGEPIGEFPHIA